jgi:hypothetical protein
LSNLDADSNGHVNLHTPLLALRDRFYVFPDDESAFEDVKILFAEIWKVVSSPNGQAVLKCSLAYVLGSLATLVAPIAGILGHNDGKHVVATVIVYFHPARTTGSMIEASIFALIAFAYSAVVSFGSMAVAVFFGSQNLLYVGHILVLFIFCGGGLGAIGWLKQKLNNPLVNVVGPLCEVQVNKAKTVIVLLACLACHHHGSD